MNVFFSARSDINTKQKELCEKINNSKMVNKNSIVLYAILCKYTLLNCFYIASTEKSFDKFIFS